MISHARKLKYVFKIIIKLPLTTYNFRTVKFSSHHRPVNDGGVSMKGASRDYYENKMSFIFDSLHFALFSVTPIPHVYALFIKRCKTPCVRSHNKGMPILFLTYVWLFYDCCCETTIHVFQCPLWFSTPLNNFLAHNVHLMWIDSCGDEDCYPIFYFHFPMIIQIVSALKISALWFSLCVMN